MQIRERIAEIIHSRKAPLASADAIWAETNHLTDKIMQALTLPPVSLKCQDCGGKRNKRCERGIPIFRHHPTRPCANDDICNDKPCVHTCTCKNGERAYRIWWDFQGEPLSFDRILSYLDLEDRDIRRALVELDKRIDARFYSQLSMDIPNNKGRLVLREEG